ncbi:MAG: D-aminoacyl-tRNA deacylase [Anaerolineae bacterium]|nr:D-aminoacyl-tRNA deacylase [Anaerolineae bacterium]
MRVVLQRVARAVVRVNGEVVGAIERGVLLLVGVTHTDTSAHADWLANKIATLRIFPATDGSSHFDRSLFDVGGSALVVSQFTLYGQTRKGRRPEFIEAARPEHAAPLIDYFVERLRALGVPTQTGIFGANMQVELVNEGPVTLILEAPQ